MGELRWGVLGTGGIARRFVADLQRARFNVAAVGSRTQPRADAFAAAAGVERAHGSYPELVADPEVDVVYVASPHPFHAEHALLALEAGRHVLVEKPFTLNRSEAERVFTRAAKLDLVVLEAMWSRWLPHVRRIRQIVEQGALGSVRALIADHDQRLPTDPGHRLQDPALGGGALLDLGVYPVWFAHHLFGPPATVQATSTPTPTGVDRQTAMVLSWPDGKQAVLHTLLDGQGPGTAAVIGTDARIELDPIWYAPTGFSVRAADGAVLERYDTETDGGGMQFEAAALEDLVRTRDRAGLAEHTAETLAVMGTLDEVRRQIGLRYPSEQGDTGRAAG